MAPLDPASAGAPLVPLAGPPLEAPALEAVPDPGIATPLPDGVPPVIDAPALVPGEPDAFDAPLSDAEAAEPEPPGPPFPEGTLPVEGLPLPQPAKRSASHKIEAERIVIILTNPVLANATIANPSSPLHYRFAGWG